MSLASLFLVSLLVSAEEPHIDVLVAKLASPSQVERDDAARQLREVFEPTPRSRWEGFVAELKPGLAKKELQAKLKPEFRESQGGIGTGQQHMEDYRLDNTWQLRCWFHNEGDSLREAALHERIRSVWVNPPPEFTGEWVTYFVNGQVSHRIDYESGEYRGTFVSNHSNGQKSVVQHYGPSGVDGEDTGFFPSGKVMYRAFYSQGKPVGVWTWYNEQGEVTTTRNH